MNKAKLAMGALMLPALLAGCGQKSASDKTIIEQPSVEVVDGKFSAEVLEALARVGNATPSPDGKYIIFTIGYESIPENSSNAEIYRMNADGTDMKRITTTPSSESNLRWLDGGNLIAFIANDEDTQKPQVFTMKPDGSGMKRVSSIENGVMCFEISPDESKIVFGSLIDADDKDPALFEGLPNTTGRVVNDLMYKHWDEWVTEIPHPFVADFKSASGYEVANQKDIMEGEPYECPMKPFGAAETFAWSPDSKKLVYTSRKLKGKDYAFSTDSNLYLYDLESGKTEILTEGILGYDTNPVFSPDGKQLAWLSMETPKFESDKKRLMVMDMASRDKRDLTANWDYWPEGIAWAPDGKGIFFHGYYEGTQPIFKIDVASAAIDTIATGLWDYVDVKPISNDAVIALRHNMMRPNEVVYAAKGQEPKDITSINAELLGKCKLGKVEKRMVPTTDGKEMCTWVILPPDFDPNKKYPAILYCQGGPQQAVSQFWSYRWNFMIMAANGYVVIAPNRRGLPGFGAEWNRQISGDYGGQNMKDYLAAVDYMKNEPFIDGEHIGAIGASYGGFSVYWLAGHHEGRFAALVAHAGIFNIEAQYLETEEMWFADFDLGGPYWEKDNAIAQRTYANSPHRFVDKWTAPILVTVGELDYRILASQGMMAFNAAKMRGLETEMLVFPDENHWVLKPQNAMLWQRVFFQFLDKYLKPQADGAKAEPAKADAKEEEKK
ncbi:MAG: S9 family peptidase [Muribaculaceae bacterium]|nr:S9 family peptidase [Muribaculaceae bacterium]